MLIKSNLCTLLDFNAGVRFDSLLQQQKKLTQKTKTNKKHTNQPINQATKQTNTLTNKQTKNKNKIANVYTTSNTQR